MSHEGLGPDNSVCKTAFVAAMKAQILADQAAAVVAGDQEKADVLAQTAANMDKPEYQKNIEPLSVDSTFIVRLKGAIGLKYLDVTPGHSRRTWPNNATVPAGVVSLPVNSGG